MEYLTPDHAELVNFLLLGSEQTAARCAALDRRYVVHYELQSGPYCGPVDAAIVLEPAGARFVLECPTRPDVVVRGDWTRTVTAVRFGRDAGSPTRAPVTVIADRDVLTTVAPVLRTPPLAWLFWVPLPEDR